MPVWHPQYLHHAYKIRALDEPLGLSGGEDQATLIATSDVVEAMYPSGEVIYSAQQSPGMPAREFSGDSLS